MSAATRFVPGATTFRRSALFACISTNWMRCARKVPFRPRKTADHTTAECITDAEDDGYPIGCALCGERGPRAHSKDYVDVEGDQRCHLFGQLLPIAGDGEIHDALQ